MIYQSMKPAALIILTIILTGLSGSFAYGTDTVKAKTDQRVELLSVVFRLAGNDEYNMNPWFGPQRYNISSMLVLPRIRLKG